MSRVHHRFPAGIAMVVLLASTSGCQSEAPTTVPPARETAAIPFTAPPAAYTGELPPLPVSFYAPARPMEVVRAVYTFAARHPEVLHYVPCFCGCQNSGHKDNDDCFIQSRDASGRPTWEPHGMT